jgi:hypothetical protein
MALHVKADKMVLVNSGDERESNDFVTQQPLIVKMAGFKALAEVLLLMVPDGDHFLLSPMRKSTGSTLADSFFEQTILGFNLLSLLIEGFNNFGA